MIDYYNNETRLTEILRAVVNSSTIDLGPARTREEIFVSRALGLTMWPAIPPRTTMEMWLAFIAGDTAEPAAGTYTVRTCAESCIITYARRVRGASAVVPIFAPHTHYERTLAKLAGIVPLDWGVLGREWEHLLQTLTVSTMPRSSVAVIGGERVGIGPGGEITPFQDLHGYDRPWAGGTRKNLYDFDQVVGSTAINADPVLLQPGTYYVYVAGKSPAWNSYIQISSDGSSYSGIGTDSSVQTAYANTTLGYNTKKCILTVVTATYCRQRLQINGNVANSRVAVMYTTDSTGYAEIPAALTYDDEQWQAIYEPYANICPIYPGLTLVRDSGIGLVVWGGTLDTTSGVLTVTDAEIASYAGETLPGEWISDRDEYAAGAVPTTGAQVVYKLADPITYQLTRAEVQRALNCVDYLGTGVWRLSCGGVTIIHAQIRTEAATNHYDLAASSEDWTFEITVDGATATGGSGLISVLAGDHDVVIVATPGESAGVCIIQPTLYYTAVAGLLGMRQDLEEPEDPEEPVEPESETTKRRRAK